MPRIVKCVELPQWIVSSDKAAYHPWSNTIYLTKWRYLPHELLHWFACKTHLAFIHSWIDKKAVEPRIQERWCPRCGASLRVAECCTKDDEWLWVCNACRETWTVEELQDMWSEKETR